MSEIISTETMRSPVLDGQDAPWCKSRQYLSSIWANYSSWDLAAGGLFLIVATLIALTFTHYGITWDELHSE